MIAFCLIKNAKDSSNVNIIIMLDCVSSNLVVWLIINIKFSVFRVPFFIFHSIFFFNSVLSFPELLSAMWVSGTWERSLIFRWVDLIFKNVRLLPPFLFILKPGAWNL